MIIRLIWVVLFVVPTLSYSSAVFDGNNANFWLVDEHGNISSYSYDRWLDTFADAEYSLAPGEHGIINNVPNSSTAATATLAPVSLAGLDSAQRVAGEGEGSLPLTVFPAGGIHQGTVKATVSVDTGLQQQYTDLTLTIAVEGSPPQVRQMDSSSAIIDGRFTEPFYVTNEGSTQVTLTLTGRLGRVPVIVAQRDLSYTLRVEDPLGKYRDTDTDGLPDIVELAIGLDPLASDWRSDNNGDGWADFDQWLRSDKDEVHTIPLDTDGDGWSDIDEIWRGTNPEDSVSVLEGEGDLSLQAFKDYPTATRLYGVEYLLQLQRELRDEEPAWNGHARVTTLQGESLFSSGSLLTVDQLIRVDVGSDDIAPRLQKTHFDRQRDEAQTIAIRTAASDIQIVDIDADVLTEKEVGDITERYHYRAIFNGLPDITPENFRPAVAWDTALEWKYLFIEHLRANLVVTQRSDLHLMAGAPIDILQSLIQQELDYQGIPGVVNFSTLSMGQQQGIQHLMDALALRERRGLWDVAQDLQALADTDWLATLYTIVSDVFDASHDVSVDIGTMIQTRLADNVTARYLARLLFFTEGEHHIDSTAGIMNPEADSDHDGIANLHEVALPIFSATYPWLLDSDGDAQPDNVDLCPLDRVFTFVIPCYPTTWLSISDGHATEIEGADSVLLVSFQLNQATVDDVSFHYNVLALPGDLAEAGDDFEPMSGTLWIAAGTRVVTIAIPIYGDNQVESPENFHIVVSQVENAEIVNNSAEVVIHDVGSDTEVARPVNVTASAGDRTVELRWDAVEGADGYRVYRGAGANMDKATAVQVAETNETLLQLFDQDNERMVFLAVEAYRGEVNSGLSDVVFAYPYEENQPTLQLLQSLDFGHINTGSTSALLFTLDNTSASDLTVIDMELPLGFRLLDFSPGDVIRGNERKDFTLEFNPQTDGEFSGQLTVIADRAIDQGKFTVKGVASAEVSYPRMVTHVVDGQNGLPVPDAAFDIAMSPAGDQIVIADTQNLQVYRRNPVTGDVRFDTTIPVETGYARIARYSPSGDKLYLGSGGLLMYDRDVETGELQFSQDLGRSHCHNMKVSYSGKYILCVTTNGFAMSVYSRESAGEWQQQTVSAGSGDRIFEADFAEDNSTILLAKESGLESYRIDDNAHALVLMDSLNTDQRIQALRYLGNRRFVVAHGNYALQIYEVSEAGRIQVTQEIGSNINGVPRFTAFWVVAAPETNSFVVGQGMLRFAWNPLSEQYEYQDTHLSDPHVIEAKVSTVIWHSLSRQWLLLRSDVHYPSAFYTLRWEGEEVFESPRVRGGAGGFQPIRLASADKHGVQLLQGEQVALRAHTSPERKQVSLDISPGAPITWGKWAQTKPINTSQFITVSADKRDMYQLHHDYIADQRSIHHYRWSEEGEEYVFKAEYSNALNNIPRAPQRVMWNANDIALSPDGSMLVVSRGILESVALFERNVEDGSIGYVDALYDSEYAVSGNTWRSLTFSPDSKQLFVLSSGAIYVADIDAVSGLAPAFVIQNGEEGITQMTFPRGIVLNSTGDTAVISSTQGILVLDRNPADGTVTLAQTIDPGDAMFQGVRFTGAVTPMHFIKQDTQFMFAFSQAVFGLAKHRETGLWQVDWSLIPSTLGGNLPVAAQAFSDISLVVPYRDDTRLMVYGKNSKTGVYIFEFASP